MLNAIVHFERLPDRPMKIFAHGATAAQSSDRDELRSSPIICKGRRESMAGELDLNRARHDTIGANVIEVDKRSGRNVFVRDQSIIFC